MARAGGDESICAAGRRLPRRLAAGPIGPVSQTPHRNSHRVGRTGSGLSERTEIDRYDDKPFRQLVNPMAPLEILSAEQLEKIHQASIHILEEVGLDFLDGEALASWEEAGTQVDH